MVASNVRKMRNDVAAALSFLGLKKTGVDTAFNRLSEEWDKILANSKDVLSVTEKNEKKILIVSAFGLNANAMSTESLFGAALAVRGAKVNYLACHQAIPSCEFNYVGNDNLPQKNLKPGFTGLANSRTCRECSSRLLGFFDHFHLPLDKLSDDQNPEALKNAIHIAATISPKDIRNFKYRSISVGNHAFSSTVRAILKGSVDFDSAFEVSVLKRNLISAIYLADLFEAYLLKNKPDRVICVHGIYLIHGTVAEVCRKNNIPVIIYGAPYRKGTLWFSHEDTYHKTLISEPREHWEAEEFDESSRQKIINYLESKTLGGRDYVNYHPTAVVEADAIYSQLKLDRSLPVISFFTNVIWDAQILYSSNAFKDIFDWLFHSIELASKRTDLQVVIRIHPAEVKGGFPTRQPMLAEILKRFPDLPSNVFIIPPESHLSSYTLAEMSKATFIYGTKMGFEIAARGIPVIVAGEAFNRGKGFTYDVNTREQFNDLFARVLEIPRNSEQMIEKALRFSYYLVFKRMIDMPLFTEDIYSADKKGSERFYNFNSLTDLLPGKDKALDTICDSILNLKPFVLNQ